MQKKLNRTKALSVVIIALGLLSSFAGDIVYVKAKGSNTEPYDTEEKAATTLDTAVAYANAQGIRKIKVVGQVSQNAQLSLTNVEIFGDGWSGANIDVPLGKANPVFSIGANVLLHGIKFTSNNNYLRALYHMTDSSAVISNCCFTGLWCATIQNEGEIAGHATAGLITHCLISGNHANNGGGETLKYGLGVLGLSGTARMANSIFTGNYHSNNTRGPNDGLLTVAGDAVLENCVIYGNYAKSSSTGDGTSYYQPRRGAGVCVRSGSPTIRNCIVRNNLKPHSNDSGEADIYNPTEAGDFYIADGATPTIENCNTVEGQVPACAVNCQTADPVFIDAAIGNFAITADSPCVDAGVFADWQNYATDYSGVSSRYQGEGVDIGAYEVMKSPTPVKATVAFDDPAKGQGEKYSTVSLSVTSVAGSTLRDDAAYTWYTSDPREGSPEPIATGMSTSYRFTAGTWTVYLKIANAGGVGQDFVMAVPNAVTVHPGADYYVSAKGNDENSGDIDAPFKTIAHAVEMANEKGVRKIKVLGLIREQFASDKYVIANVELYGADRQKDSVRIIPGGDNSRFHLGENAVVHDLMFRCETSGGEGARNSGGCVRIVDDSAIVSNCWIKGCYFTTGGNPAGNFTMGLITHTLFTENFNNNSGGTVLSVSGTAKMRNCIFTGNMIRGSLRGPLYGVLTVAGTAEMENCVVYDNYAAASKDGEDAGYTTRYGGGVYIPSGSPVIRNCIVRNNTMSPTGVITEHPQEADIYIAPSATPKISYCNLPAGQVPASATNCQTGDPLFADPDNATLSKRDFMIAEKSPCRNAGRGWKWQKFATDYTGVQPRRQGGRVDIGAYEYPDGVIDLGLMLILR